MAGTILTNIGLSKLAAATPQNQLNITHIAVGDGNGGFPTLSPTMTALTNEVWRGGASNPVKDASNTNYVYFETNIPPEVGPFDVREIACFDSDGDMIAIGHTSLIQKPNPSNDASFAVAVKIFIALENASDFDLIYQNAEVTSHNSLTNRNERSSHEFYSVSNVVGSFDKKQDIISASENLNDGDAIEIDGEKWLVSSTKGESIGNGLFMQPFLDFDAGTLNYLTDYETGESFRPAIYSRLMNISNAFKDVMLRTDSGSAPFITCYGDSNTRYYQGDSATYGPYSRSYGAHLDVLCAEKPYLYQSTIEIKGFPNKKTDFALLNFDTEVNFNSNFVVLGWGTNNISQSNPSMTNYIDDIINLFEKCIQIDAMPIMLGIPWFVEDYGQDGVLSQDRLKTWNSTLYALCKECNVPFIDTYNLTRKYPSVYFNETDRKRHYSPVACRQIAGQILQQLQTIMLSNGKKSSKVLKDFSDLSSVIEMSATITRAQFAIGGLSFETLVMPSGSELKINSQGRGCVAFYPRAVSNVTIHTPQQLTTVDIDNSTDAGEYYPIKRVGLTYLNSGQNNDLTITVNSGTAYIRMLSFEDDSALYYITKKTFKTLDDGDILTETPVTGRSYLVPELSYEVTYRNGIGWISPFGFLAVGTTSQRDAMTLNGIPNGYKFYNITTSQAERYNLNLNSWSAT